VLLSSDTAAMLFWVPLASGQIIMRKIDELTQTLTAKRTNQPLEAAARSDNVNAQETA